MFRVQSSSVFLYRLLLSQRGIITLMILETLETPKHHTIITHRGSVHQLRLVALLVLRWDSTCIPP